MKVSRTARIMIMWVIAVCLVFAAAGLLIIRFFYPFEKSPAFLLGLALGGAHSAGKIALLEKSLRRIADMQKESAAGAGRIHFVGRYLLTAAVFAAVLLSRGVIGVFGAIAGILSMQVAALITGSLIRKRRV